MLDSNGISHVELRLLVRRLCTPRDAPAKARKGVVSRQYMVPSGTVFVRKTFTQVSC